MIIVIDLETTGLDPVEHEIIEIGAVLSGDAFAPSILFERKVNPEHLETASQEAFQINGFTPESWGQAIPLDEALVALDPLIAGDITIAGWGVAFDVAFLKAAYARLGLPWMNTRRRLLDICSAAQFLLPGLESYSLTSVAEKLGVKHGGHRALADAMCTLEVARKLREVARL